MVTLVFGSNPVGVWGNILALGARTVVFGSNTVVFRANTVIQWNLRLLLWHLGANTVIIMENTVVFRGKYIWYVGHVQLYFGQI